MQILRGIPQAATRSTALTVGNFDGVHIGHQALLSRLREAASERRLSASVLTFEPHPREFLSPQSAPPRLTGLREKVRLIDRCNIDFVYVQRFDAAFSALSARDFLQKLEHIATRFLIVGDDFRFGRERAGDFSFLEQATRNFEVERMSSVTIDNERVSSSAVRAALARNDFNRARLLLGRHYSISGRVIHGAKLGARLGFRTANIELGRKRPPIAGIFVVEMAIENARPLRGVASLGFRPTVSDSEKPVLEVHVFDFDAVLYGKCATVFFLHKLRDEAKYRDLDTLSKQIAKDVEDAKNYFSAQKTRDAALPLSRGPSPLG
jgi:riboflavin kinase/FMN adenylyltransferase